MDFLLIGGLAAVIIYCVIFVLVWKKGFLKKYSVSPYGPFLMWRTKRGRKAIGRWARFRRGWQAWGDLSILICILTMVAMFILLIFAAVNVRNLPKEYQPQPQMMLGIPGVNPIIPVWYGIFGLAVAIVVHEVSHGILSRVTRIKLLSLGLLFCVVPIGAFAEPDEEELGKAKRRKRMRIYAVGPSVNILFALACALMFSWGFLANAQPREDGVIVTAQLKNSALPTLEYGTEIIDINGTRIHSVSGFDSFPAPKPLEKLDRVMLFQSGKTWETRSVTSGVFIVTTIPDYPANKSGLKSGMVLYSMDNAVIRNNDDFSKFMNSTSKNQVVNIVACENVNGTYRTMNFNVTLADKYEYYSKYSPTANKEEYRDMGFMGISCRFLGVYVDSVDALQKRLAHPLTPSNSPQELVTNGLVFISLPLRGLAPLQSPVTDLYTPSGIFSFMSADMFWILANTFYWLFWINIMVGLTNALPAIPLDGGYVFKDSFSYLIERTKPKWNEKKREYVVRAISYSLSLLILALLVWQLIGPRLRF